nr:MAG TPA: hypothetical protein [Caudoviricetes sp.]
MQAAFPRIVACVMSSRMAGIEPATRLLVPISFPLAAHST